jgi:hypothetical protein
MKPEYKESENVGGEEFTIHRGSFHHEGEVSFLFFFVLISIFLIEHTAKWLDREPCLIYFYMDISQNNQQRSQGIMKLHDESDDEGC